MKGSILLIDSGIGGISTLKTIKNLLPYEDYIYYADNKNMPYGEKSRSFLVETAFEIIRKVSEDYALKVIVLACNTLTGAAVKSLRDEFENISIVGMEPAYKPASERGGKTAVLCTAVTRETLMLNSKLYGIDAKTIVLPKLAVLIEEGAPDKEIMSYINMNVNADEYSNIVLGCTHYCLKKKLFEKMFCNAKIFDGNEGVARRVKEILKTNNSLNDRKFVPSTVLVLSKPERTEINKYIKLLRRQSD